MDTGSSICAASLAAYNFHVECIDLMLLTDLNSLLVLSVLIARINLSWILCSEFSA